MKKIVIAVIASVAAITSVPSFSQTNGLTRAQVKAELLQVEKAGYSPSAGDNSTYPADIQAAEAKVQAQNAANTAYGSDSTTGTTQSGSSATAQH